MFAKFRKAASARRQAKKQKDLGRAETEQNRRGVPEGELTDYNELIRMGPNTGGPGPV